MLAVTMDVEVIKPRTRLLQGRAVTGCDPPHDTMLRAQQRAPFTAARVKPAAARVADECFQAFTIVPDAQATDGLRIAVAFGLRVTRAWPAGAFHHPHETRRSLADAIDGINSVQKSRGVVPWRDPPADIALSKVERPGSDIAGAGKFHGRRGDATPAGPASPPPAHPAPR